MRELTTDRPGAHKTVPLPPDAAWMTAKQLMAHFGGVSQMWLWRKIETDPDFPRPVFIGRFRYFRVDEVEAYDRVLRERGQAAA